LLLLAHRVGLKAIFLGSCVLGVFFCGVGGSYFIFLCCGTPYLVVNLSGGRISYSFGLQGKVGAMFPRIGGRLQLKTDGTR